MNASHNEFSPLAFEDIQLHELSLLQNVFFDVDEGYLTSYSESGIQHSITEAFFSFKKMNLVVTVDDDSDEILL